MSRPPRPLAIRLSHAFSALVRGYRNEWSEGSGDFWKPFHASLDPSTELTVETFRTAAHIPAERSIGVRPFDAYFDYVLDPGMGHSEDVREAFRVLKSVMELLLTERITFKVGEDQITRVNVCLVGRIPDGAVVGLQAIAVETG